MLGIGTAFRRAIVYWRVMKIRNQVGHYSDKKAKIKFETDVEKQVHKLISAMRFMETVTIPTNPNSKDDRDMVVNAVRKSAFYNCMEVTMRWHKKKDFLSISAEI